MWRKFKRTFVPQRGAIILCYHRVADLTNSPRKLRVSPQRFAEQLDLIACKFTPISLAELVARIQNGTVLHNAVVVTFDDGYADNFWNAKPLLERFGVPATVFVTTGFVGTGKEFYWDELEQLLLNNNVTSDVHVDIKGQKRFWRLKTPQMRLKAYNEICDLLASLSPNERETILKQLRNCLGTKKCDLNRVMNPDELIEISQSGLIEIGAHTVNHPDLSVLPPECQWQEITTSKSQLEGWLNRPIRWFAYPYGRGSAITKKLVQEAGFEGACAVKFGLVNGKSDPFWLPRIFVENWDGDVFLERILWL
ncbi:MAG: polysaccharide deacetylase family protein [Armatimonadota bacterium]|nr:polysaccharide deacetylase family protein [Armatimonadota bacterium]